MTAISKYFDIFVWLDDFAIIENPQNQKLRVDFTAIESTFPIKDITHLWFPFADPIQFLSHLAVLDQLPDRLLQMKLFEHT